jgi:endonuclease YncB( thermonuclease family)
MMAGRRAKWTVVGLLLAAIGGLVYHQSESGSGAFSGRVTTVSDGDTIGVMDGPREARVRLFGVDCPEKSQPHGMEAKQFTSSRCFGKEVRVKVIDKDRYGRIVGEVTLPDGSSLNRLLVEEGYAWWYRHYSKDRSLGELEAKARKERRGLWADKDPEPPWEYREHERETRERRR